MVETVIRDGENQYAKKHVATAPDGTTSKQLQNAMYKWLSIFFDGGRVDDGDPSLVWDRGDVRNVQITECQRINEDEAKILLKHLHEIKLTP